MSRHVTHNHYHVHLHVSVGRRRGAKRARRDKRDVCPECNGRGEWCDGWGMCECFTCKGTGKRLPTERDNK